MGANFGNVSGSDAAAASRTTAGTGGQARASTVSAIINCRERCTSPEQVFVIANALAALFASQLTQIQLQTLINLLAFLVAGLSTIVTQQQLCQGLEVNQTPVE